jgi:hypothetical protein
MGPTGHTVVSAVQHNKSGMPMSELGPTAAVSRTRALGLLHLSNPTLVARTGTSGWCHLPDLNVSRIVLLLEEHQNGRRLILRRTITLPATLTS